ncbi:MAG TPA: tyrosine-type recombinase/integrase [Terriglobia bacterium]|nr:tyrosine-type recombinase/integrase [Terriglobia bacterium]
MQARYQYGTLTKRARRKGPDVWQWRWTENGRTKSVLIGTVEKYQTKADAERAVESLRMKINAQSMEQAFHPVTVGALIDRFMEDYAPKRCRPFTRRCYQSMFKNHIRPRWEKELVRNVKTMAVEDWLEAYPHSRQTKSHIRSLMHVIYQCAVRWEMAERNPIDLVRQSRKRLKTPRALAPAELRSLLSELTEPYRTMVLTAACLGLRVCELLGLQWRDLDFDNLSVKVQRSVIEGRVFETKNQASEGVLPLDAGLAESLRAHKSRSFYVGDTDFVFAGDSGKARWKDGILADYLKPAAVRAGIGKIGWHTFRHTYSTLLHALGAKPAVQKELLRHANIQTTMNIYTQAVSDEKREMASRVAGSLYQVVPVLPSGTSVNHWKQ